MRRSVDLASWIVGRDQPFNQGGQHLGRELTGVRPEHGAEGVDEDERRPRADREAAPDPILAVVDDRMRDPEASRGGADPPGLAFRDVLAAVDADDHDFGGEAPLELPQFGNHVLAIDAPVRPKVDEDDFAAQGLERQTLSASVDPIQIRGECRRANGRRRKDFVNGH